MNHEEQRAAHRYEVRHGGIQEKIFRIILSEERGPAWSILLKASATLIAWFYDKVTALRNLLFDLGVLRSHKLNCPVISVGNLTVGGTGKTPMVVWLARFLADHGWRVGIVSRGYGGVESGGVIIVSDGESILADSELSGDEAQLLARRLPGIPVFCSTKRVKAGKVAVEEFKCEILILDDGFQHRYLARDLDVVMLDARSPFGNGRLFPRGIMRERDSALARAQVLVLSRFDHSEDALKGREDLLREWPDKRIARAAHRPVRLFAAADQRERPLSSLKDSSLAAFAGIGRPDDFFKTVQSLGARLVYAAALPDHHPITPELLSSLVREASGLKPELWLTTEKDWVRLPHLVPEGMELWVVAVEVDLEEDGLQLTTAVRRVLKSAKGAPEGSE
jgi:tetraacyldisaccharide 4'-kinase